MCRIRQFVTTRAYSSAIGEPVQVERIAGGLLGDPDGDAKWPLLSGNGRFVAFQVAAQLGPPDFESIDITYLRDRGLIPDGRNDLVVDFGARGFWQRLDNGAWSKIDAASPGVIAVGDLDGSYKDEVIASFAGRGLLARYNNAGPWRKLHDSLPQRLVSADFDANGADDLAADFGAEGLWVR